MGKRISNIKCNTLRVYREADFRGKERRKTYGIFSGAGLLGTGSPTYPRGYTFTENGIIVNEYHIDINQTSVI